MMLSNNQTYRLSSTLVTNGGTEFPPKTEITIAKIGHDGTVRFTVGNDKRKRYRASSVEVALKADVL